MEYKGSCVVIQYCAVLGRLETPAQWVKTCEVRPSVTVYFKEPGEPVRNYYIISPDNVRFAQIEVEGRVIWDSRQEVPCDMAAWEATNARHQERRAFVIP
jgi:hypothetical protein